MKTAIRFLLIATIFTSIFAGGKALSGLDWTLQDRISTSIKATVMIQCSDGSFGSGVMVSPNTILTARHVIIDVNEVDVLYYDGTTVKGKVLLLGESVDYGYVIVESEKKYWAKIRASGSLREGELIYTIGTPFGRKHLNSVSIGIVSSSDRRLEDFGVDSSWGWEVTFQMDITTYPGCSGGPIFRQDGTLVGIVVGACAPRMCYGISINQILLSKEES